jgi:hypothetical protein
LLSEIRKSNHNEAADKQEVELLKNEVGHLKDRISHMSRDMEKLTSIVSSFMQTQQMHKAYVPEVSMKKRKMTHSSLSPVRSGDMMALNEPTFPLPVGSMLDSSVALESNFLGDDMLSYVASLDPYVPGSVDQCKPPGPGRRESIGANSFTSQDEDMLSSLFSIDQSDDIKVLENGGLPDMSISMPSFATKSTPDVDPILVQQLRDAVSKLPEAMQKLFVDRIVATIAEPEGFKNQVEAMTSLATSAAGEAKRRLVAAGISPDDPKCVQLASAVLGAYLARFTASTQQDIEASGPAVFMQI